MRKLLLLIIVGVGVTLAATSIPANALLITFELDEEYTGGAEPLESAPWLTATFEDAGLNQVSLTLDTEGLTGNEFVSNWFFNIQDGLIITSVIPFFAIVQAQDARHAGGAPGHGFDIEFEFPTAESERFGADEIRVFLLGAPGLTALSFEYLNAAGNFYSAAHVQSITNDDFPWASSGWIGARRSIAAVPEPGTILLLGAGLAGLFGIRRFKFKKN